MSSHWYIQFSLHYESFCLTSLFCLSICFRLKILFPKGMNAINLPALMLQSFYNSFHISMPISLLTIWLLKPFHYFLLYSSASIYHSSLSPARMDSELFVNRKHYKQSSHSHHFHAVPSGLCPHLLTCGTRVPVSPSCPGLLKITAFWQEGISLLFFVFSSNWHLLGNLRSQFSSSYSHPHPVGRTIRFHTWGQWHAVGLQGGCWWTAPGWWAGLGGNARRGQALAGVRETEASFPGWHTGSQAVFGGALCLLSLGVKGSTRPRAVSQPWLHISHPGGVR